MQATISTRSSFAGARVASAPRAARQARAAVRVQAAQSYEWLKKDPVAIGAGILGWLVPAGSPAPAFGGNSLLGVFNERIAANMANFPQGPALDDPIWLYMLTFHMGLFACMFWGQIGVQARKQGYFD